MAKEMLYMRLSSLLLAFFAPLWQAAEWESSISPHTREHTHTQKSDATCTRSCATRCLTSPSCCLIYSRMRARAFQTQKSALSFPLSTLEACRWHAANWFKSERKQRAEVIIQRMGGCARAKPFSRCKFVFKKQEPQAARTYVQYGVPQMQERWEMNRIRDREPGQKSKHKSAHAYLFKTPVCSELKITCQCAVENLTTVSKKFQKNTRKGSKCWSG